MHRNEKSPKLAFFLAVDVGNALDNTNGDSNAKSPPHYRSMARWERRTTHSAAVSPVAAENHVVTWGFMVTLLFYFSVFVIVVFAKMEKSLKDTSVRRSGLFSARESLSLNLQGIMHI